MAEAAAWKARLRQRVVSAHDSVRGALNGLHLANAFIELPLPPETTEPPVVWLAAIRAKISHAMESLTAATQHFNSAVVYMEAAQILALHGANSADPSVPPLASIQHVDPQQEPAVRAALERLHNSRVLAALACRITEWCRGHLSMAIALIESPGIPYAIALARRELFTACGAFTHAVQLTQTAFGEVTAARQILGA